MTDPSKKTSAVMEFIPETGGLKLKNILLHAQSDKDQLLLERTLSRIVKPVVYSRLFREDVFGINPLLLLAAIVEEMQP
jgi:hypothetical protein